MTSNQPDELQSNPISDINATQSDSPANIDAIASILRGETPEDKQAEPDESPEPVGESQGDEEVPDSEPDESPKKAAKPKDLNDLAERLGLEVKDIYAIEFPNASGETHTIGELKDLMAQESDFSRRDHDLAERKVKQENELLRAKQQLSLVLKAIPADMINRELLAKANAELEAHLGDETRKLLSIIPEWGDAVVKEADLQGMGTHMEQYGFGRAEVDRIIDHRMVKYIRDNMQREKRMAKALEDVKEVKRLPKGQSKSRTRSATKAPVPTSEGERTTAIADLLK